MTTAVRILRDPLCGDAACEVPRDQWPTLMRERQHFCREVMPSDCRMLLFFVEDAAKANWLGFETRDDYLLALGLDPDQVQWALDGLQRWEPDEACSLDEAIRLGKHGGDRRSEEARDQPSNRSLIKAGTNTAYTLARLRRDHPELAERVADGELSANAAAIEAGFRRRLTPFEQIVRLLPKLTADERAELRRLNLI
jgi:hypothetical protein